MTPPPQIVIGTTNPAKARQCRLAVERLGLRATGIEELLAPVPEIPEQGGSVEANARAKAIALAALVDRAVLALDYALFFDGVPDPEQPGLNVRRVRGLDRRPTDDELLGHYSDLIRRHGGRVSGRWEIGAALATPDGAVRATTTAVSRTFVDAASPIVWPGYPLASLQLADVPGRTYVSELTDEEEEAFFARVLDEPLSRLLRGAFAGACS
jgi:hypothetical protein